MHTLRLQAMKERLYMQRELRRLLNLKHKSQWLRERKQGRINFLVRHLEFSYKIWN